MSVRKQSAGAPSWMVTFADMMSLLLALFVLLLSFSVMDAQRYKQVAGSMRDAFGLQQFQRLAGIIEMDGNPSREHYKDTSPVPIATIPLPSLQPVPLPNRDRLDALEQVTEEKALDSEPNRDAVDREHPLLWQLKDQLAEEVSDSRLSIEEGNGTIVISFPDSVAFASGSATLSSSFQPALDKLARVLEQSSGEIVVAGHTDSAPIATERFRSNWDLSTARAVSVVHYWLENASLNPRRLTAQGHADSRPVIINATPQESAVNRRVEISIGMQ